MNTCTRSVLMTTLAVSALAISARADVIITSDGSRIVGTVKQWADGKVSIETSIAGTLTIDTSKITAIDVDNQMTVQLESGDRLVGTLEVSGDESTTTMRSAVGDIPVDTGKITAAWSPDQDSPEIVALKNQAEAYKPHWKVTVEGGGTFKEGNTDEFVARGRVDFLRKTPDDSLLFYASADYGEQNKIRNKNEYKAGTRYEQVLDKEWSWYMRSMIEHDEFENLDLRALIAGGIAYKWIENETKMLQTSLGAGYRHEAYNDNRTEDDAIIDLGLNYRHDIAPWIHFTHALTYSPAWNDTGDYRLDADTALVLPFKSEDWKLKLGVRNEYNSRPRRGIERLDNTFYANILVELK